MKIVGPRIMSRKEIKEYVRARLAKGTRSAGPFAVRMLKAAVSLQAPRRRIAEACGWEAVTRALSGAPPRRVSGCGQNSIYWRATKTGGMAFGAKKDYMMILEKKGHPWLRKTMQKYLPEILKIWGSKSSR